MGRSDQYGPHSSPPPYEYLLQPSRNSAFVSNRRIRRASILLLAIGLVSLILFQKDGFQSDPDNQLDAFIRDLAQCNRPTAHGAEYRKQYLGRLNPRWAASSGQQQPRVLLNATLFDGEAVLAHAVDIRFDHGIVRSISKTQSNAPIPDDAQVVDLYGRFVTPGLVDIHSHHLESPFSSVRSTQDVNEKPNFGPITPFIRAIDGFKPYDPAIRIIASGGVTSSLLLPGSGNIIGGQAFLVKNLPNPGGHREPVVEELLLDYGIPKSQRQRYLKMACGENPKYRYGYTRLGNAWLLRQHLERAQNLKEQQDDWCSRAQEVNSASFRKHGKINQFMQSYGHRPAELELEASVALLSGDFNVNIHCYEPEDFERMLAVLHEFGVHPQAFHHALEAWQVPEFLKQQEPNITIATFAENALFKHEAYGANLRGPKILDEHGIRVVLKSDHFGEANHAKYVLHQAAVAHSFGLPEIKALQAVTSAGARSIQQDHRIGFVRPGYDADLVVWDAHPLSVGATPLQVYVDGREVVSSDISNTLGTTSEHPNITAPVARPSSTRKKRQELCTEITTPGASILFTGIKHVLLDAPITSLDSDSSSQDYALLLINGSSACLDLESVCSAFISGQNVRTINLTSGYLTPGLTAFGNNIGILDISSEPATGDGISIPHALNPTRDLHFAKHGVHFGGRGFGRARLGGVTKAITAPLSSGGVLQGVSVGLSTHENASVLHGGIWQEDVALHFTIGQEGKGDDTPTISSGIERIRQVLENGQRAEERLDDTYVRASNGSLPVIIYAVNEDDIAQIVLLKRDFPTVKLVVFGGHGAPLIAEELAHAKIPVILTGNRGAPDTWAKRHTLPGPPLSPSPAQVLLNAGVSLALAVRGDSKVHGLAQEAQWAAKFARLNETEAIKLVSTNFNEILRFTKQDIVVWEGNPLKGEGSVVVSVLENEGVGDCWPDYEGAIL